jgi:hypothetical protein
MTNIPRRTNWIHHANALSQLEVTLAGNILNHQPMITFHYLYPNVFYKIDDDYEDD